VPGKLFVVSGPSGAGKGTLLGRALIGLEGARLSVSATTRHPRKGERDGVQYFFLSDELFDKLIATDGLLEWAAVHGARYGTLKAQVLEQLAQGIDVILEIDPQGAFQVKRQYPAAVTVFIKPPSLEELRYRLEKRGTENEAEIEKRVNAAIDELSHVGEYDKVILNDDLVKASDELLDFIRSKRNSDEARFSPACDEE
jgi:guanylate kinase